MLTMASDNGTKTNPSSPRCTANPSDKLPRRAHILAVALKCADKLRSGHKADLAHAPYIRAFRQTGTDGTNLLVDVGPVGTGGANVPQSP